MISSARVKAGPLLLSCFSAPAPTVPASSVIVVVDGCTNNYMDQRCGERRFSRRARYESTNCQVPCTQICMFDIGFDIIWYYEITYDLIIPNAIPNLSNGLPARCLRREVKNLIKISSSRAGRAFGTI